MRTRTMIGNGPYTMKSARSDEEIVLVAQRQLGRRCQRRDLARITQERIVFRIFADPDTSYNALEAGEIDIANIPPARSAEAQSN